MSYPKDLDDMAYEVHEVNVANGWFEEDRSFGDMIALLHSECSEALEAYRSWKLEDASRRECEARRRHNPEEDHSHQCKPEGVGSELADVFIRVLDMAYRYKIDLHSEYNRKIAYNRTRGYKHGGRTL